MIEGYSKELNRKIEIEKGLVKPLLKGDDVHRYETLKTDRVVIFPYFRKIEDGKEKAELYSEKELQKSFPKGYAYLKECESVLRDRESGRFNIDGEWFQFGRKQGIIDADKEKLMQPDISMGCNFAYDEKGEFYSTTTNYGYKKYDHIKESYKFYMAILNSKVLWWYLQQTGTTMANGFFRFKPDYINPFPLPKIENIEDTKPFEILVDYVMFLKALPNEQKIDEYVSNKHITKQLEEVIDAMVFELYFVDEFRAKNIEFIKYAKESFKQIENFDDTSKQRVIKEAYLKLCETKNPIRNNLLLLPLEFDFIKTILWS